MISTWSEWKRYPRAARGENLEAPISPGIYEVRYAATGAVFGFGAVDSLAQALATLSPAPGAGAGAAAAGGAAPPGAAAAAGPAGGGARAGAGGRGGGAGGRREAG